MTKAKELGRQLIADLGATFDAVDEAEVEMLADAILAAPRIFVDGRGRSGLQARGFAMRLMHLGLAVHVVNDVTTDSVPGSGVGGGHRAVSLV